MGGFVSLGVADAISIYQNWHYGVRGEAWNKVDYEMAQRGFLIDLLNTIREEIRDQVSIIISSLDNMMLVSTLVFGIGITFCVEGKLPPAPDHQDHPLEKTMREVYTVLVAASLVLPFWALIFTLRIRYEVDICLGRHMEDLQQQLVNVLMKNSVDGPGSVSPQLPIERRDTSRSPSRGNRTPSKVWKTISKNLGTLTFHDEVQRIELTQIARWAKEDLPRKLKNYDFYYPLVQLLLWLAMLSIIFTSTVLVGLCMLDHYQKEPWMWVTFVVLVGLNGFLSMLFVSNMLAKGEVTNSGARRAWQPLVRQESPVGRLYTGYGTLHHTHTEQQKLPEVLEEEEALDLESHGGASMPTASPSADDLPSSRFHRG